MYIRRYVLLLACLILVSSAEAVPLHRYQVRNAAARLALCNDGSPAVYYFRPGSGTGVQNWVVFLGGGGFCFSVESCRLRFEQDPQYMTSRDKPATLQLSGLLSDLRSVNPDFYNANHVVIPYCTSDLWSGDRPASDATGGFRFRGQRVFRAVIQDVKLQAPGGTAGLMQSKRIILGGTSAGGAGVMVHLDWLATQFPAAQVRGLNDGGWIPPFLPIVHGLPSLPALIKNSVHLWNGKPDASCAAANPNSIDRCYQSTVYPYIQTPMLVQESQWDTWALGILQVKPPFSTIEWLVANYFASQVRGSLAPVHAAFSPRTHTHGLAPYTQFNTVRINGLSLRQVFGNWIFNRPGPKKEIQR